MNFLHEKTFLKFARSFASWLVMPGMVDLFMEETHAEAKPALPWCLRLSECVRRMYSIPMLKLHDKVLDTSQP